MPDVIEICEVGPRDGLQANPRIFSVDERIEMIERLSDSGIRKIEAVSFVNPKRVPQMANAEEVLAGLRKRDGVAYAGLALNRRGAERALDAGVSEIRFAVLATETFNQRNQGVSVAESIADFSDTAKVAAGGGIGTTAVVSAAFGCPFEGTVSSETAIDLAMRLIDAGARQVIFADTIGCAVPTQVRGVLCGLKGRLRNALPLGVHLHNTRNTGFANAVAAIESGATVIDASIGGLGGCPFAPDATGNIATEDLAHMLRNMGIDTGMDLDALIGTVGWLEGLFGHNLPGQLARAKPFPECATAAA